MSILHLLLLFSFDIYSLKIYISIFIFVIFCLMYEYCMESKERKAIIITNAKDINNIKIIFKKSFSILLMTIVFAYLSESYNYYRLLIDEYGGLVSTLLLHLTFFAIDAVYSYDLYLTIKQSLNFNYKNSDLYKCVVPFYVFIIGIDLVLQYGLGIELVHYSYIVYMITQIVLFIINYSFVKLIKFFPRISDITMQKI